MVPFLFGSFISYESFSHSILIGFSEIRKTKGLPSYLSKSLNDGLKDPIIEQGGNQHPEDIS